MSKVYRLLAVALLVIGLLVIYRTVQVTISDVMNRDNPNAIKCDHNGCRTILSNGSLADDSVVRPESIR